MVNARRPEPDLRDLESLAFLAEQVRSRHPHIVECEFADRGGVVLASHPAQPPDQANARRVHRHDDAGMAAHAVAILVGHAHHDQKTALRMGGAGDEPFAPGDDVIVAVANHFGGDVGGIG